MRIIPILVLLFAFLSGYTQDLSQVEIGMSRKKFKAMETQKPLIDSPDELTYLTKLADLKIVTSYTFNRDKLESVLIILPEPPTTEAEWKNAYKHLKNYLISYFGEPTMDDKVWMGESNEPADYEWMQVVGNGALMYVTKWTRRKSEVSLMMAGKENDINIIVGIQ